jgi:SAM-dependent methyltransferase
VSDWNSGYVTDISYTANHHPEAAPHHMALACRLAGYATDLPERRDGVHTLELGCGRGIDALLVAAANPGWQVTAVDFMPAAIAEARSMARAAGIDNVRYIEADLARFAETEEARALPMVDAVSIHGVWSWVPAPVQAGIVRLLAQKVLPGGLVHVSYNALPGLQGALALQRVIYEAGRSLHGRSDAQAAAGIALARDLVAAEAKHLQQPVVTDLLDILTRVPVEYIAHEYMNAVWQPCFQADVAAALAPAKLDFVGVSRLLDNFQELMLTEAQQAIVKRFEGNARVTQLLIDCCTTATFRHDIYVRGALRLNQATHYDALCRLTLALTVMPENFVYAIGVKAGEATLNRDFYGRIVAALAERPHEVGALLQIGGAPPGGGNPAELIGILVGTGQAIYLPRPEGEPDARIARVNAALAHRLVQPEILANIAPLASARTGSGLVARVGELFLAERIGATGGAVDPAVWAAELGPDLPAEQLEMLRETLAKAMRERQTVWRHAGVL